MINFNIVKTVFFDLEDDLADRVLTFVECDMWYDHPDQEDYNSLSGEQRRDLIIAILEATLEKYKNSWQLKKNML